MLGKLMKYELKSSARILLPLYAAALIMSCVTKLTFKVGGTFPRIISSLLMTGIFIAFIVMTFLILIQRFYKNLLGDEGYLMFTLPVKSISLIFSKLVGALIWLCAGSFISIISFLILAANHIMLKSLFSSFIGLFKYFNFSTALVGIQLVIFAVLSVSVPVLMVYSSLSIGQLSNSHKGLASFGTFIGISTGMQIIASLLLTFMNSIHAFDTIEKTLRNLFAVNNGLPAINLVIFIANLITAALAVLFFYLTNNFLTKKLNLE
ncbi:MAG: hypothetical protein Q8865_10830 [Bacillota bacterium]|nr:hypothetical protein [Bacillota bacterium]